MDLIKDKRYREQPPNINPDLWERFLTKNKYDGIYYKLGVKMYMVHTNFGIIVFGI